MKDTFTAIDFETAQSYRWSICQVGLVRVENGEIIEELDLLVQPPGNYYWDKFVAIHGIKPEETVNTPTFDKIWYKIESYITNQTVVAHNGMSFDFPVLRKTLEFYEIKVPLYEKCCTYRISKKNLASLCDDYSISLNHHDALSDARACSKLFQIHLQKKI